MDDEAHEKRMKAMFSFDESTENDDFVDIPERTAHDKILPAKDRIKQYKTKNLRRNIPSAWPATSQGRLKSGAQSTANFKGLPASAGADKIRPITAAVSAFGMSDAPTAVTSAPTHVSSAAEMGLKNHAISMSRFSKFEETEKAVQKLPFNVFYTSNEPTLYHKENRFEGKSCYNYYYPTGEMHEQELE